MQSRHSGFNLLFLLLSTLALSGLTHAISKLELELDLEFNYEVIYRDPIKDAFENIRDGSYSKLQNLLDQGMDPNGVYNETLNEKSANLVFWAAYFDRPECIKILVRAGGQIQAPTNSNSETALFPAAYHGRVDALTELLLKGGDPNFVTADGRTPLICAALSGNVETAKLLLIAGADKRYRQQNGKTAYDFVCKDQFQCPDYVKRELRELLNVVGVHWK